MLDKSVSFGFRRISGLFLEGCLPAEGIVGIVQLLGNRGDLQRLLGLDHNCQFVRRVLSDARFHSSRLWSVVYASSVECERSYLDSSTTAEIAAYVVEDLVTVNVAVVVRDWYGLRVVVEFSRDEG